MIVITGASDGLGLELATLYKESGQTVVNVSLEECSAADHNFVTNLSEGENIIKVAQQILAIDEPLDILINCAGVWTNQELGKITESEIKRTMEINVKPVILLTSELIERVKKDGTDIANVSSTAGLSGSSESIVYSVSKWAVRGFSDNLRQQLNGTDCRVVTYYPDGFASNLMGKHTGEDEVAKRPGLMSVKSVALALKQMLDLPKGMEASELVLHRKK